MPRLWITSCDFVCLTETYIASDFDSDLFRDFSVFSARAKKKLPYHGRLSRGVDVGVYLSIYLSCKEKMFTVRGANARGCEQCGSTTNGERSATLWLGLLESNATRDVYFCISATLWLELLESNATRDVYFCISATIWLELLESNATRLSYGAHWKVCYGPGWCNWRFLKKVLLGTDMDVMFISAYLPPYDSNYGPAWCNWRFLFAPLCWPECSDCVREL